MYSVSSSVGNKVRPCLADIACVRGTEPPGDVIAVCLLGNTTCSPSEGNTTSGSINVTVIFMTHLHSLLSLFCLSFFLSFFLASFIC
jgi:hypothetical protein